jgi:hypothetical protein
MFFHLSSSTVRFLFTLRSLPSMVVDNAFNLPTTTNISPHTISPRLSISNAGKWSHYMTTSHYQPNDAGQCLGNICNGIKELSLGDTVSLCAYPVVYTAGA